MLLLCGAGEKRGRRGMSSIWKYLCHSGAEGPSHRFMVIRHFADEQRRFPLHAEHPVETDHRGDGKHEHKNKPKRKTHDLTTLIAAGPLGAPSARSRVCTREIPQVMPGSPVRFAALA